jgi:transposase
LEAQCFTVSGGWGETLKQLVEGLNNKLKLTLKRSYGFRTDLARKIALFHALGKLPEPQLTHSFF